MEALVLTRNLSAFSSACPTSTPEQDLVFVPVRPGANVVLLVLTVRNEWLDQEMRRLSVSRFNSVRLAHALYGPLFGLATSFVDRNQSSFAATHSQLVLLGNKSLCV